MSSSGSIHACLVLDDAPISAAYWARLQQSAFGYRPTMTNWGRNWPALAPDSLWSSQTARTFADIVEEFGVRGKATLLPCPAGLGRIDRSVRGYSARELEDLLDIFRERLAPSMDITPEVLTHTMAFDVDHEALLPHSETAWLTHLCATGATDALEEYVGRAYAILHEVGIAPRGLTVGGIEDISGIENGQSLLGGHHRVPLCQALLTVERKWSSAVGTTFLYTGSPPLSEQSRDLRLPETIHRHGSGSRVFEIHSHSDPLYPVLYGPGDVSATIDAMISRDLETGSFVTQAESGGPVVFTVHTATLSAMSTGAGFEILREALTRFRERYGNDIVWLKSSELCLERGV